MASYGKLLKRVSVRNQNFNTTLTSDAHLKMKDYVWKGGIECNHLRYMVNNTGNNILYSVSANN